MTAQSESFIHSNAIIHLLSLIAASERTIKEAHEMGHDLIVRQYQHLRNKDIQDLNKILQENGLQVLMIEAEKLKSLENLAEA